MSCVYVHSGGGYVVLGPGELLKYDQKAGRFIRCQNIARQYNREDFATLESYYVSIFPVTALMGRPDKM